MPLDLPSSPFRPRVRSAVPVAIVSGDPLVVAGIRAALGDTPNLWLVDDPAQATVVVWDPPPIPSGELPSPPRSQGEPSSVIALVEEGRDPLPLLAVGVRGLLHRDVDAGRLQAAILAVDLGLSVLDEDPVDGVVASWSPQPEPSAPSTGEPAPADRLTPREREVLTLVADGLSNRAIAEELGVSPHTVKFHVDALLDKLGARSRTHAVVEAVRRGLLQLV